MYQDSFRSVVHRSLSKSLPSKSKDKNETAQCGAAARIQKASPSFASNPNFRCREREKQQKTMTMACRQSSEAQLLKVCQEAQVLNQVINSWSREPNFSKHFAEDLLRGALDLQESLAMLENFRAASKSFPRMNDGKRRKQELAEEGIEEEIEEEEVFVGASASDRFLSGGSSRNRVEELKRAIKDSFHRQNLLSAPSDGEKAAASSSSRSEDTGTKKPKASNLIAKLMGLEEEPLEQAHPIKKEGKMWSISSRRAFFDIEMPKARRIQPAEESSDADRKAFQEIVETMHFKGLLKSNQAEEQHRKDDEAPPIVIMKPVSSTSTSSSSSSSYSSEREGTRKDKEARHAKLVRKEKAGDDEQVVMRNIEERKESNRIEKSKAEPSREAKASTSASGKQRKKETIKLKRSPPGEEKQILAQKKAEEKKEAARLSRSNSNTNKALKRDKKPRATSNGSSSIKVKKTEVAKQVRSSSPIIGTVMNGIKHKRDQKTINPRNKKDGVAAATNDRIKTGRDVEPCMEDDVREDRRVSCEVTPNTSQVRRSYSPTEEAIQCRTNELSAKEASGMEGEIKLLLLSSPSFLSLAQELAGLETYRPVYNRIKGAGEVGIRHAKLYLDAAEEQMARKHEQNRLFCPVFRTKIWRRANYFSLEDLVEDIDNGIGKLNSYSKFDDDDDGVSKDDLYVKLERDVACTDMTINSMWDVGWVDLISGEDVNRVVSKVSEHILSLLVQEICAD